MNLGTQGKNKSIHAASTFSTAISVEQTDREDDSQLHRKGISALRARAQRAAAALEMYVMRWFWWAGSGDAMQIRKRTRRVKDTLRGHAVNGVATACADLCSTSHTCGRSGEGDHY